EVTIELGRCQNSDRLSRGPASRPAATYRACVSWTIASTRFGLPRSVHRLNARQRSADTTASETAYQLVGSETIHRAALALAFSVGNGPKSLLARTLTVRAINVPCRRSVRAMLAASTTSEAILSESPPTANR